ncbi:LysM peptidoglycan-binding domain-containing protein [Demequina flava]|uniref:LysM peptidoglycan-binding domain-containing protein n=1 Tax=Demequina flava TaxID=1095025 RepID=UPI00078587A2|nr:LysM peptidoglycan-binding domain-containing protein [Demequina flava]
MTAAAMTIPAGAYRVRSQSPAPAHKRERNAASHSVGRVRIIDSPVMRRRRRVLAAVILAIAAAVFGPQAFAGDGSGTPAVYDTHTVAHGETLWSIASSITAPGEDVRDAVADISNMNAMSGSTLQVGEQLRIPALD